MDQLERTALWASLAAISAIVGLFWSKKKSKGRPVPAPVANVKAAYRSASSSEAHAKADELGLLAPGAVAAALHLAQKPESTIYVHGAITCVCAKSLPLEVAMIMTGGGPVIICPDCGTRIATMEAISGNMAVVTASIEAVKRQYQSSRISLNLSGFTEQQVQEDVKPSGSTDTASPDLCDWCSVSDLHDNRSLIEAFNQNWRKSGKPDWRGLERMSAKLPEGWMRHVLWLDKGVSNKTGEPLLSGLLV